MSRIAPDIPELQHVPEALRSIAYTRALNRTMRQPMTWLLAVVIFAVGSGIGSTQGGMLLGTPGALVGAAAGFALAFFCFFRLLLPWRVRRVLPSLTDQKELEAFDQVRRANEGLKQIATAFERDAKPTQPRGPERLR